MANFEVFSRRHQRAAPVPTITFTRRRTLSLNQPAFDALGAPAAVKLLWDREERIVGVRAAEKAGDDLTGDSYLVNKSNLTISAGAFTRWVGLEPTALARRWNAFMEGNVLCIRLTDPPTELTSNRSGRTASGE